MSCKVTIIGPVVLFSSVVLSDGFCQNVEYLTAVSKVLNKIEKDKTPKTGCDSWRTSQGDEDQKFNQISKMAVHG